MAITVLVPTPLRPKVGNHECIELDADSVRDALDNLTTTYPEVEKLLFMEPGVINKFIGLYVNDEDVKFLDNLNTKLASGDELTILAAIAGG